MTVLKRERPDQGNLEFAMQKDSSRGSTRSTISSSWDRQLLSFAERRISRSIYLEDISSASVLSLISFMHILSTSNGRELGTDHLCDPSFKISSASTGPSARFLRTPEFASALDMLDEDNCMSKDKFSIYLHKINIYQIMYEHDLLKVSVDPISSISLPIIGCKSLAQWPTWPINS